MSQVSVAKVIAIALMYLMIDFYKGLSEKVINWLDSLFSKKKHVYSIHSSSDIAFQVSVVNLTSHSFNGGSFEITFTVSLIEKAKIKINKNVFRILSEYSRIILW